MKHELAVLPLEVWADIFISPYKWINRQKLAQFADNIGNRQFTEKLQKLLHGCGKHSLRHLLVSFKPRDINVQPPKNPSKHQLRKRKFPERQASLAVAPHGTRSYGLCWVVRPDYKDCEFPECEMPENINNFKQLTIGHFDDKVLAFLHKIKPLFTNVSLSLVGIKSANNARLLFAHLLPMLGGIREITCKNDCLELLAGFFPDKLAMAKELDVVHPKLAAIWAYFKWLNAAQNFDQHGPRFLKTCADAETIFAIIDAVRRVFYIYFIFQVIAKTIPSTPFVIFLEFSHDERRYRAGECRVENPVTNEHLTIRNAHFKMPKYYWGKIRYVEIMRHPIGEEARMQEWLNGRAYYEKIYKEEDRNEDGDADYEVGSDADEMDEPEEEFLSDDDGEESNEEVGSEDDENEWNEEDFSDEDNEHADVDDEAQQVISIVCPRFGYICTNPGVATNQAEEKSADDGEDDDDMGPSTSAKIMKK